jgi:hypothetical protein
MNPLFVKFKKIVTNPISFTFFLLQKLPAAFFVGLKVHELTTTICVIKVRYSWFSKNPFKSMYFAAQAMAAEMSTGLLAFGQLYKRSPKVSMLVIRMEVNYMKKGTGMLYFTCEDGQAIQHCIQNAIETKQGQTLVCKSTGKNEEGEVIAEFFFTWSFKSK